MITWLVKFGVGYIITGIVLMNAIRGWQQQPPPGFWTVVGWVGVIPYESSLYASKQDVFNTPYQPAVYYIPEPKRRYDRW